MNIPLLSRVAGWSLVLSSVVAPVGLRAQSAAAETGAALPLDRYVISASRSPQDPAYTPSAVSALSLPDLASQQVDSLKTALAQSPGVIVVSTGATGGMTSVFLRGANQDETLFVVDGVRLNTSTASYNNFLGGANLAGLDRIEILRGPQSTLYGSSAMGGVILLETAHGSGQPTGVISAEVGSFGTLAAKAAVSGTNGTANFSLSLEREQTNNSRAFNRYTDWSYSTRIENQISPWLLAGFTFRGLEGHYEEPGAITYAYPGVVKAVTHLATFYVEAHADNQLRSRLTYAWYQDGYTWDDGSVWDFYYARNTRDIIDWQNTWTTAPGIEVVAGVNAEWSAYAAGGMTRDRSLAEYVSATAHPWSAIELTAGLRHDHFNTAGDATTGRVGVAYVPQKGTKLRATYGTGFNAPTPGDRLGVPPYILPNPQVRPEKSRGWDAGIDQTLPGGETTLSATFFDNRFHDLLEYEVVDPVTYAGRMVNLNRATTRGVELAASTKLSATTTTRLSYTYLDARDDTLNARLIRRPRHSLDDTIETQVTGQWQVGAGVHLVANQVDGAYTQTRLGGYTTVRMFTRYDLRPNLTLKLRIENLLDRHYQEVSGFPALPRGIYGAVEWKL